MTQAQIESACENTIDAIGFQCDGGRQFSVRNEPTTYCAVVFEGDHTYVLPLIRERGGDINTDGHVVFARNTDGRRANLTGTADGDFTNCHLIE
jgi:hypothetical protein